MKNRLNNYNRYGCCAGDIVILAIIFFLIIIIIYTLVAYSTGAFAFVVAEKDICDTAIGWESNYQYCDKQYDELVERDEQLHKEWAKENDDNYQFVRCPNDTNIYPEDTKCNEPNIDWDEVRDNTEANREEEKAMNEKND